MLFVERARHLRRHPGEIGLPGGAEEDVDVGDPERTALRELREELNIDAADVKVVGRLEDAAQSRSRFIVTPIVAVLDQNAAFSIDGDEIAGVFAVPLASLVQAGSVYEEVDLGKRLGKAMYALDFEGHHIWGFTARILKSFVDAWNEPNSELRAAIAAALGNKAV